MKAYLRQTGLPSDISTDASLHSLAKCPLFGSFCIANTNDTVQKLNEHIASFVVHTYDLKRTHLIAQEESEGGEDTTLATPEKMADYEDYSIPVHDFSLFRGARVSLLRNIALSRACANGSTFIVMEVGRHSVKLMNITPGNFFGNVEFMFRVKLKVTLRGYFTFTRLQFPLRMAFAGTAHKYQGQTCESPAKVFYDVRTPPFCHGQSYVGMSRAQQSSQLIILSLPEHGRCVPCIIYPKLVNWDKTFTLCAHDPNKESPPNDTDSESTHFDCGSTCSSSASDFEPSGLGDTPFVPQNDFMNADTADFPDSDDTDNEL